ncbi:MAG: 50S ribosomal protein L24 [Elusimicrobia bacterium]|nr:50S ribosomal protein L24 [Elusimicrobiota bacterium]MDE2237245.1 50S ribosomal protein L24 [Elusimicrobiota bacterium]MDE2425321.1 50S ribosomal protein L24 [Elusimicrobiota bacterium]
MPRLKLRKKDKVMVIAGKDKGRTGEILKIYPERLRILVGKVNMVTKHRKPTQTEPGGLQKMEAPIHCSNVMLVCPKCEKPTRAKVEKLPTGELVRSCRRCGEHIL